MALAMKAACERCGEKMAEEGEAYICSYECTFCRGCREGFDGVCPNCGGELLRRPRRAAARQEA